MITHWEGPDDAGDQQTTRWLSDAELEQLLETLSSGRGARALGSEE
jgi:hypothetical protein